MIFPAGSSFSILCLLLLSVGAKGSFDGGESSSTDCYQMEAFGTCFDAHPECAVCGFGNETATDMEHPFGKEWAPGVTAMAHEMVANQCKTSPPSICEFIECCPVCKEEMKELGTCLSQLILEVLQGEGPSSERLSKSVSTSSELESKCINITFDECPVNVSSLANKDVTKSSGLCMRCDWMRLSLLSTGLLFMNYF